jgi:hypothetical protein
MACDILRVCIDWKYRKIEGGIENFTEVATRVFTKDRDKGGTDGVRLLNPMKVIWEKLIIF